MMRVVFSTNTTPHNWKVEVLEAEVPIVEHLTSLDQLPDEGFRFFAVPVKVERFGSFPVRAFGLVPSPTSSGT